MYTASRMLFVLAARNEAPEMLVRINRRGVPANAILFSSIIGFICVIAAAFAEKSIFAFLLNSSGAIPDRDLGDRAALPRQGRRSAAEDVAVPGAVDPDHGRDAGDPRTDVPGRLAALQFLLSLLSWAVVLGLFFLNKRFNTSHHIDMEASEAKARTLLND